VTLLQQRDQCGHLAFATHLHKSHLVPFGEFCTPRFSWIVKTFGFRSRISPWVRKSEPLALARAARRRRTSAGRTASVRDHPQLPQATLWRTCRTSPGSATRLARLKHLQISRMRALETEHHAARDQYRSCRDHRSTRRVVADCRSYTEGILTGEVQATPGLRLTSNQATPIVLVCVVLSWSARITRAPRWSGRRKPVESIAVTARSC